MLSTDITSANIYQFLGSRDEGIGTICEDEADNIDEDKEKMKIYKMGILKASLVFRMLDSNDGKKQTRLNTFCFKAFAAEQITRFYESQRIQGKGFRDSLH